MPQKTINQTRWISKGGIQFNLMVWVTKKKNFWGDTTNYKTYKVYTLYSWQTNGQWRTEDKQIQTEGSQNPFFQSKVSSGRSLELMITSVGVAFYSQRGQCVTRLGTFLHTSVELNVSILMLPQRLVESYCFQWVILLVRNPKMGLNSTFFKIVETGSIGDVWYAGAKIELEEESRSGGWCTWSS